MTTVNLPIDDLAIYLHLARASERRCRPLVRDKLLVLASVAAARRRLDEIAQFCRQKILARNPAHLVGHWPSLAIALEDHDFLIYLRRLNQLYPLEKAEHMLDMLGIELARERHLYQDDQEYATALLDRIANGDAAETFASNGAATDASGNASRPARQPDRKRRSSPFVRRLIALVRRFR